MAQVHHAICAAALSASLCFCSRASPPTKTLTILALPESQPRAKLRKFIYTAFLTPLQYVASFSKHTLSLFTYSINCSFLSQLLLLYLSPILCLTSPCDNQTPSQHRLCFFFLSYHQQNRISDKTVRSRLTGMTACCDPFLLLFKNDLYLNFVYF